MPDKTIEFLLLARDQASAAFDKAGDAAVKSSSKIGGALKTFGTGALLGVGVGAAAGLASAAKDAFAGAQEAAQITRVLNSQIQNLGPSGRAAFGQAAQFADSLSASIGQDDDDIKKVQTKLASFPDAFRQGSLGADAMRRATTAAFDLQAIGIGDATSNIVGIGKALNDPIKGMNALSDAGVSFSESQQKAIKQAIAQGDLAKAQEVILQGIESNAKGAAAASTSNIDKIKVSLANMAEGLAGSVIPLIEKFAGFLLSKAPQISAFFDKIGSAVSTVIGWFTQAGGSGQGLATTFGAAFQRIWAAVGPVLQQIWTIIQTQVVPAFSAFIKAAIPVVTWLVSVLAPVVSRVFAAIAVVIKGALQIISGILNVFAGLLTGNWSRLWTGVKQIFSGAWTAIKGLFSAAIAALSGVMSIAVGTLKAVATRIGQGILDGIKAIIGKLAGVGRDIINGLISGIQGAAGAVWNAVTSIVNKIPLAIRKIMGIASPSKVMAGLGRNMMDGLLGGLQSGTSAVESHMTGLALTPSAGRGVGIAGAGNVYYITVQAGAVGSDDFLARTIRDSLARVDARGYGASSGLRMAGV